MARSRRKYRRSTSRNAASLLALALPAPLQRLASSQIGPLLVFFGVPAMLVVGLLQIDWQNGTPQLKVNAEKAGELRDVVKGQLGNLENQPIVQQWEQTARDAWRSHQPSTQQQYPQQQYPQQQYPQQQYPQQQYPIEPGSVAANNSPSAWAPSAAPFPSTSPPNSQYISTLLPSQSVAGVPNYSQFPSQSSVPGQYPQQQYPQQDYSQQPYSQQQQYPQQNYSQQQYQQQLYQHQQYQQPQYRQQLSAEPSWPSNTPWQSR